MAACLLNFKLLLQNTACGTNDLLNLDRGSVGPLNTKASFDTSSSPAMRRRPCSAIKEWLESDVQKFVDQEARILQSSSIHCDTELWQSSLPYLIVIKAGCAIQHIYRKISLLLWKQCRPEWPIFWWSKWNSEGNVTNIYMCCIQLCERVCILRISGD